MLVFLDVATTLNCEKGSPSAARVHSCHPEQKFERCENKKCKISNIQWALHYRRNQLLREERLCGGAI